ncbi:MAG: hypothetical protein Kow00108_19180 [Calditrichia bacterium]
MRWILLVIFFASGLLGQTRDTGKEIYNPDLDVKQAIQHALERAQETNKHILLMFGGNWCPWCHKLHQLLLTNETLNEFLNENYILIMIDVGEKDTGPINRDLLKKYRVDGFGFPALAVLSVKGELLASQSTGVLESGKGHDYERVMGFLKANAPSSEKK